MTSVSVGRMYSVPLAPFFNSVSNALCVLQLCVSTECNVCHAASTYCTAFTFSCEKKFTVFSTYL